MHLLGILLLALAGPDRVLRFAAADGTALEAKLSLPEQAEEPVAVVFYLHGAGPRTYDNKFHYVDTDGATRVGSYLDHHAGELVRRGVAFCRMSKRGCQALEEPPFVRLDREVFARATPSVLLDDYEAGLEELRAQPEIDAGRIVLLGASEGTYLAPQLALRSPDGIAGLVMYGFASDPARETVIWQNSTGPWRRVQRLVPAARDGALTRAEHQELIARQPELAPHLPFDMMDHDHDDLLTEADLVEAARPRLDRILKAVKERDDRFLAENLLELSSAYLLDWWEAEPTVQNLLRLAVPLVIFHGELDDTCRVEGVHEAAAAFRAAGKTNLEVHIVPLADHGLGWSWQAARDGGPEAFQELFDRVAEILEA